MPNYLRYFAVKYAVMKKMSTVTQDTDFTKTRFALKMSHILRYARECNFIYGLPCTNFHDANCSTALRADFLYRILPKTDHNCGKQQQKLFKPLCKSTAFTAPSSTKFRTAQWVTPNFGTEFHRNRSRIWEVRVEIHSLSFKYDCHWVDFHENHACLTIFC
jgi:hypothetical protein